MKQVLSSFGELYSHHYIFQQRHCGRKRNRNITPVHQLIVHPPISRLMLQVISFLQKVDWRHNNLSPNTLEKKFFTTLSVNWSSIILSVYVTGNIIYPISGLTSLHSLNKHTGEENLSTFFTSSSLNCSVDLILLFMHLRINFFP